MQQLFYTAVRHRVTLKTLMTVAILVTMAIAVAVPGVAFAGPDASNP